MLLKCRDVVEDLVSVIIPVYKVEWYLRKCLDSVINQTYQNLEIILVDDGSPDGCPKICDKYANKDNRIKVIHKKNGGLSDARNKGLDVATGEYITFIDSDDWVSLSYIESFVSAVKKDPQCEIISAGFTRVEKKSNSVFFVKTEFEFHNNVEITQFFCEKNEIPISAWNKLYKSSFIKKHQLSFKKGLLFEDQLWCFQCYTLANHVKHIPLSLYFYRVRNDSIMRSSEISISERITSWSIILEEIENQISRLEPRGCFIKKFLFRKAYEALRTYTYDYKAFKLSFYTMSKLIRKSPILYWGGIASPLKKKLLKLLSFAPAFINCRLLYFRMR